MSVVGVLLLLALTLQISEEQQLFVVRSGTTVTLPCGRESPTNCTWTRAGRILKSRTGTRTRTRRSSMDGPTVDENNHKTFPVVAVSHVSAVGVGENLVFIRPDSHRLNLTESCELQIRDVEEDEAGVYVCKQLDQLESGSGVDQLESGSGVDQLESGSAVYQSQRSESFLSVVSFDRVSSSMICKVSPSYGKCGYMVKWLVQGWDRNRLTFRTSQCSAEVTYSEGSSRPNLSCEVTDLNHNQVFVLQSPGSLWNQTESGPEEPHDSVSVVTLLMLVIRSVELLMVSVVMVILLRGIEEDQTI